MNTINGQQEQPEPKPVKFNEKEIYEFEEALKERAVRVLDRKWAPNTRNQPFAIISGESAKDG
jgi:phosphate uptake regulator